MLKDPQPYPHCYFSGSTAPLTGKSSPALSRETRPGLVTCIEPCFRRSGGLKTKSQDLPYLCLKTLPATLTCCGSCGSLISASASTRDSPWPARAAHAPNWYKWVHGVGGVSDSSHHLHRIHFPSSWPGTSYAHPIPFDQMEPHLPPIFKPPADDF